MAYTFVVTAIIAKVFDSVPCLRLRADDVSETIGMDDAEVCSPFFHNTAILSLPYI